MDSLKNASFSATDADHFPAPIRLENVSTVPVLYQQNLLDDRNRGHHLRAICPAGHTMDSSRDNVYAAHQLILQVFLRAEISLKNASFSVIRTDADHFQLCIRAAHIEHWSCPIRIDQIASFLMVMRDRDETPRFLRAEISLKNASFSATVTDANHFPAPIRLENASTVPVLYQQNLLDDRNRGHHLRAICPAGHTVDYSWDNVYAANQLLQVYENKFNIYDPRLVAAATPLYNEDYLYIRLASTFPENSNSTNTSSASSSRKTSTSIRDPLQQPAINHQCLVLAARREGKVVLARLNPTDSSRSQLWRWGDDGCLENVGMSLRVETTSADERYVLDVLEGQGGQPHLMMLKRDVSRNRTQRWVYTADWRVKSAAREEFIAAADGGKALTLLSPTGTEETEERQRMQRFQLKRQEPGTGTLDVQCIHKGPMQMRHKRPEIFIFPPIAASPRSSEQPTDMEMVPAEIRMSAMAMGVKGATLAPIKAEGVEENDPAPAENSENDGIGVRKRKKTDAEREDKPISIALFHLMYRRPVRVWNRVMPLLRFCHSGTIMRDSSGNRWLIDYGKIHGIQKNLVTHEPMLEIPLGTTNRNMGSIDIEMGKMRTRGPIETHWTGTQHNMITHNCHDATTVLCRILGVPARDFRVRFFYLHYNLIPLLLRKIPHAGYYWVRLRAYLKNSWGIAFLEG